MNYLGKNAIRDVKGYSWISRVKKFRNSMKKNKILVTGSSGFIGFHVCYKLLKHRYKILGLDNHNNYYDPKLKQKRLNLLKNLTILVFLRSILKIKKNT